MSGHKPSATKAVKLDLRIEAPCLWSKSTNPHTLSMEARNFLDKLRTKKKRDVKVVVEKPMWRKLETVQIYFSVLCKPLLAKFLVSFFKLLALWVLPDFVLQHQTFINSFNWTCVSMPPFNLRLESEETPWCILRWTSQPWHPWPPENIFKNGDAAEAGGTIWIKPTNKTLKLQFKSTVCTSTLDAVYLHNVLHDKYMCVYIYIRTCTCIYGVIVHRNQEDVYSLWPIWSWKLFPTLLDP